MLEESRTAVVVNATSSFHASGALVVSNQRPQSPKLLQQDHQTARAGMRAASCCPPAAWMLLLVLATAAASAALPVASDTPSPATQRATGNEPAVSTAAGATAGTGGRRSLSAAFTRPTRRRPTRRGRPTTPPKNNAPRAGNQTKGGRPRAHGALLDGRQGDQHCAAGGRIGRAASGRQRQSSGRRPNRPQATPQRREPSAAAALPGRMPPPSRRPG